MIAELDDYGQFIEWQVFEELEPLAEEQANYNAAQIVQALWNIARDTKKHPQGWPLSHFVLPFGDAHIVEPPRVKQTVEEQERIIDAWIMGSNAFFVAKQKREDAMQAERDAAKIAVTTP